MIKCKQFFALVAVVVASRRHTQLQFFFLLLFLHSFVSLDALSCALSIVAFRDVRRRNLERKVQLFFFLGSNV